MATKNRKTSSLLVLYLKSFADRLNFTSAIKVYFGYNYKVVKKITTVCSKKFYKPSESNIQHFGKIYIN
jgi:hypothetical protein